MGPTVTTEQKMLLTKRELDELGAENGVEVPGNVRSKGDTIDVLDEGGITDAKYHDALVRHNHIDAPTDTPPTPDAKSDAAGDNSDNSSGSNDGPAPTPPAKPSPKAKTSSGSDDEFDLDNFDPDDELELPTTPEREAQASLTEQDIPKLREIEGVYIRRIKRTQEHSAGRETWWCPWTDASRLSPDDPSHLDQIDASKAIRLGRFAVVLPPQGIRPEQLR